NYLYPKFLCRNSKALCKPFDIRPCAVPWQAKRYHCRIRLDALCCKVAHAENKALPCTLPSHHAGRHVGACYQHVALEHNIFSKQGNVVKVPYAKPGCKDPDDL